MLRPSSLLTVAALAASLAVAALVPALAGAATTYTIRGGGFGHGVGLSQYGAQGMAKAGKGHRRILAHYYRGARLGAAPTDRTRVLLAEGLPAAEFTDAARIPGVRRLYRDTTYRATATPEGEVELRSASGKLAGRFPAPLTVDGKGNPVRLAGPALNGVSDGQYRGSLVIGPEPGGLTVVNHVGLEGYLRGVVPGEMPASWHPEALEAQAVAARSYALATARRDRPFDQYPDMRSQVYKGFSGEDARTDAAIAATAGQVVLHDGKVATTFFFSTSGGRTEANENTFGGSPLPYLRSVDDPHDRISPHHRWALSLSRDQMEQRLGSLVAGRYEGIRVLERGDSPRILRAEVIGTRGRRPTTGSVLRARLDLRDSWASFGRIDTTVAGATVATRSPAMGPPPEGVLTGRVVPAPPEGRIVVQQRERRGWKAVQRGHTDRAGRFRVAVERTGVYRVRARGSAGPAVRVR